MSAVKQGENGEGWVMRLFNPTAGTLSSKSSLNGDKAPPDARSPVARQATNFALPANSGKIWRKARLVDLKELEIETLAIDANGAVSLEITKQKTVTIEYFP